MSLPVVRRGRWSVDGEVSRARRDQHSPSCWCRCARRSERDGASPELASARRTVRWVCPEVVAGAGGLAVGAVLPAESGRIAPARADFQRTSWVRQMVLAAMPADRPDARAAVVKRRPETSIRGSRFANC